MKYLTIILLFATILTGKAQITIQDRSDIVAYPSVFHTEITDSTYSIVRDTVDYIILYLNNIENGRTETLRARCAREFRYEYIDCSDEVNLVNRICKVPLLKKQLFYIEDFNSTVFLHSSRVLMKWLVSDLED